MREQAGGKGVELRLARGADAAAILEIYAPIVQDSHISFEAVVPTEAEMAARIAATLRQYPWLICAVDGRLAGYAYASAFRARLAYQWTAETTVYVHADFQRRGIARGLMQALLCILQAQGYCSAVGVIALPNAASLRLHEALGYRAIGVFKRVGYKGGAWHDTGWWQRQLREHRVEPEQPRAIHELKLAPLLDAAASAIRG